MRAPRVAHQPSRHPYLDHLGVEPIDVDVWDVGALGAAGVDLVHVHFGFEHLTADDLARWADALARRSIPLVHTVHDLDNPHLVDQLPHRAATRVLVHAADEVLTLTEWAAERLWDRHGRIATVVGHPPIVPAADAASRRADPWRRAGVYVHAATLRPNLDLDLVADLAPEAARWGGMLVHVRDGAVRSERDRELLDRIARAGATVEVAPRLTDPQLWDRIGAAGAILLPYRWGTHSGLLEAATDLGTPVVAPRHGGFGDQGAITYAPRRAADALDTAVRRTTAADDIARAARREWSAKVHEATYARLARR